MSIKDESLSNLPGWALFGVPSSAGARRTGQEGAPSGLRAAGLVDRLRKEGLDIADLGDLPPVSFRPDAEHPKRQNLDRVIDVARRAADRVDRILGSHQKPLVLGGDCSLSLGVIAGFLRHREGIGLLYFDGDIDLNTPETTQTGIFDGMVMAHLIGRGAPELSGIGPRCPLMSEEDIVLFGYNIESGWIDPPELELLERSRMSKFPSSRVRTDAVAAAKEALRYLENRSLPFLVHFDVDVMNFPAADVPHPHALDPESTFAALRIFLEAPACAGLVVTELNTESDPDGAHAERLVDGLVAAFAGRAVARA